MKNLKNLLFAALAVGSMALSGCLHIIEEVTFKDKGNGSYAMKLDMSEVKSMMELLKSMAPDSTDGGGEQDDDSMAQMGEEISGIASTLKGIQGITNVVEVNDTSTFMFGYSFDFADVAALNRALKILNKEKAALGYKDDFQDERKDEDFYKFSGKTLERLPTGDLGEEMRKALAESSEEEEGEDSEMTMDMMKMMFADMSYKQIYHFPDQEIKKSSNELGELSDNNHTLTVTLKPFDEEQAKKKATVATEIKLK